MGCASKWAPVKNCGRRKVLTGTIDVFKSLGVGLRMGLTLKACLVTVDHDDVRSGDLGRIGTFFKPCSRRMFLIHGSKYFDHNDARSGDYVAAG